MKATLEFQLPEDQTEFSHAVRGSAHAAALGYISETLFRPSWKHGYYGKHAELLNSEAAQPVIAALHEMYGEIMRELRE